MLVSILLDFLCMLEHTHLIKMRVGLIRRDKEGPALSESAAGILEGEEEENGKKKKKSQTQKSSGGEEWWFWGGLSFPSCSWAGVL